jgi:hypothetical protein
MDAVILRYCGERAKLATGLCRSTLAKMERNVTQEGCNATRRI